jgi:hypothetical protein
MSAERELREIAEQIRGLERNIVGGSASGYLPAPEEGQFKALVAEAKQIFQNELGTLNDFSLRLGTIGFAFRLSSPGSAINEAVGLIDAGIRQMQRKTRPAAIGASGPTKPPYVEGSRIAELASIRGKPFDLSKLVQLCKELNIAAENECNMTVAMVVRTIINHVPPIFGYDTFAEVANNYGGGGSSFKKSMKHLHDSLKNIADRHLHTTIRPTESLPTPQQVNFHQDLDVLLEEIVRILRA